MDSQPESSLGQPVDRDTSDEEVEELLRTTPVLKRAATSNEDTPTTSRRRVSSPKEEDSSSQDTVYDWDEDSQNDDGHSQFDQLLHGVVFVISGIQNPERTVVRGKGIEMGAEYKAVWDDSCTHLICAFKHTPKYNQVIGHGIIVNENWIDECYTTKAKLPHADFQL